jgi:hypothetical protein
MEIQFNSKIFLIETEATIGELNDLEAKIKNIEVFPVLFVNDCRSLDASFIFKRIWDVDDYSIGVFLPQEVVKAIVIHLAKYGLKSKFKNIDYEVFCNSYDLTNLEPVLINVILKYLIHVYDQDDVLDKMNKTAHYKLTEMDEAILRKMNPL